HPFYQHSDAEFFIAEDNGKILARIAVISNNRFNQTNRLDSAFFYFYESIDDQTVSNKLFETVFDWARERGHTRIYGPKGLLQGDGIGLLVKGFDYIPAVGISYNFPYYDKLVKQAGFQKKFDYFSGYLDTTVGLTDKVKRVAEKVKERSGFWVRKFETKDELLAIAPELREVYNAAFSGSEGFSPITEDEIILIAKRMLSLADPRLIKLVYKENKIIGFLFSYPNINRGLQKTNGRLFPFGWYHIMREFNKTRYMDTNGIGILPEYQGLGPTAVIYTELEKTFREFNFEYVETVQTREDNLASLGESSHFVMDWTKTHRVYEMDL
ncbi:MAG: GNAT family N-acetyltransferase, partial [Anaerolineales bacterium]|nr:GNAT family N-acetyltransferase [Anaerolineales bacterium]